MKLPKWIKKFIKPARDEKEEIEKQFNIIMGSSGLDEDKMSFAKEVFKAGWKKSKEFQKGA